LKRLFRFNLLFLFAVITVVSLSFAFIAHRRANSREQLTKILAEVGYCEDVDVLADPVVMQYVSDLPAPDQVQFDDLTTESSWKEFIGDTGPVINELQFTHARLTSSLSRSLRSTYGAKAIEALRIYACEIDADAKLFFVNWPALKMVVICDTDVPAAWPNRIAKMKLEHIALVGDCGPLTPMSLTGLSDIENITFFDSRLDHLQRAEVRKRTPVNVAFYDEFFRFPRRGGSQPDGITEHNPLAYLRMKWVMGRLHKALYSLDPPARNRFQVPAKNQAISSLEDTLCLPLPEPLRAFYEIHDGQADQTDGLVRHERMFSIHETVARCLEWTEYVDTSQRVSFERFIPLKNQWIMNPKFFPVGEGEGYLLAVNLSTGRPTKIFPGDRIEVIGPRDLYEYFELIIRKIKSGDFTRQNPEDSESDCRDKIVVDLE